jgi:cytoskeletal protein CcmA (bactofilin family)
MASEQSSKGLSFIQEAPRMVTLPDTSISGKLSFSRPVKIDSRFSGEVKASALVILGPKAEVKARISAGNLQVEGRLVGTVRVSGWIEIHPGGRFQGAIESGKLKVYPGGIFEGTGDVIKER